MTRHETFTVERIDRAREHADAKEERTARQRHLEERARSFILCELGEIGAEERADYAGHMLTALTDQLVMLLDPPSAASALSKASARAGRDILPRKIAEVRAQQLFARADNDGEGER